MSRRLKHLMLVTVEDPYSVKSWSGIPFSLREALAQRVERLSVFRPSPPARTPWDVALRLWHGGKPPRYPLWMTKTTLKKDAREVQREIERVQPDAVLSISSQCVAFLDQPRRPVFLFCDAPWLAWHEAYEGTLTKPVRMAWFADQEARAAQRLDGLCFGSKWAVSEARRLYGQAPEAHPKPLSERMHVTPLGANWTPKRPRTEILELACSRPPDRLELLYVGKDWERKGGPLAVETARLLHQRGLRIHLHIVGCMPELAPGSDAYVTVHGRLYQDDPEQNRKLTELFESSHFLLVPTTAECFGIVFAEAQAFALPPVSRAIHALPSVITDGETGILLDPGATAAEYAERIFAVHSDRAAYKRMATSARDRYESLLNWDSTAQGILTAIEASLPL